jgi:hypothetical protein
LGKSCIAAIVLLWFVLTRDGLVDWKVATTASSWHQLVHFLWPEIHKWQGRLNWGAIGRPAFNIGHELLMRTINLSTGSAFAIASNRPEMMEGAHARSLLYVFDEAKSIMDETFDAVEGAFAGAGNEGGDEAFALAISTPGAPLGRFYDIHSRKPGYEDWHVRHVTLAEALAAGRIGLAWAEARKRQWGETSALYQNRVLGEFAAEDANGVIPLAWVEAAVERWQAWQEEVRERAGALGTLTTLGLDVGGGLAHSDLTVLAPVYDLIRVGPLEELRCANANTATMEWAGQVLGRLRRNPHAVAIPDVIGLGAGLYHRLVEQGAAVRPFNAAWRTDLIDRTEQFGFVNARSAMWYTAREMLDPASGIPVCLPDDDQLIGELTAPLYSVTSGGRIKVEGKEDVKKRLHRSTDHADPVLQALVGPAICDEAEMREGRTRLI